MKQSVVIKIGAFAPNIIIYTGNMGRLNKVKKKESKNVKIKRFRQLLLWECLFIIDLKFQIKKL